MAKDDRCLESNEETEDLSPEVGKKTLVGAARIVGCCLVRTYVGGVDLREPTSKRKGARSETSMIQIKVEKVGSGEPCSATGVRSYWSNGLLKIVDFLHRPIFSVLIGSAITTPAM